MNRIKLSILVLLSTCLFLSTPVLAKGVPAGNRDRIILVSDLPASEAYTGNDGEPLSLGTLHNEFAVAFIPIWVNEEPRLVLFSKENDNSYYDVDDKMLDMIVAEQNLNKEELLQLGFFTRYGGKLILIALILMVLFFKLSTKNKEEKE